MIDDTNSLTPGILPRRKIYGATNVVTIDSDSEGRQTDAFSSGQNMCSGTDVLPVVLFDRIDM